jgi:hypothetical protein
MSCLLLIWSMLVVAEKVNEPTIKLEKLPNGKYSCEVTNASKINWYYVGYSPKTMVKAPPADLMFVMPHIQHRQGGRWNDQFNGGCGVGLGPVELPSGSKARFDVRFHPNKGDASRVGLTFLKSKEWKGGRTIWSNEIQ